MSSRAAASTPAVSVLISSRDRFDALVRCLDSVFAQQYAPTEILVLDNNSDNYSLAGLLAEKFEDNRLHCFRVNQTLGVAAGRNSLMERATGDIFFVIDDDAYFAHTDAIFQLVATFQEQPQAGIIATKIIDYRDNRERLLIPFSRLTQIRQPDIADKQLLVSYYYGGGHALRRELFERCHGYDPCLIFGEEELDLSYRAIQAGFQLLYLPEIVIHHNPGPPVVANTGDRQNPELFYQIHNRFYLAYRYLPWPYLPYYLTFWSIKNFFRALKAGASLDYFEGLREGIKLCRGVKREPLSSRTVAYLKAHHGRLWY